MTRLQQSLFAIALLLTQAVSAQTTPPSADEVIASACKEATATHRKVFLIFHASWCGWCHKIDTVMANPVCKQLFADQYVVAHLVILENGEKKSLENPGAQELYTKYAGPKGQGIPFWLIIDQKGAVIADSRIKADAIAPNSTGNNTGYPAEPDEVAYFKKVLQATSSLSAAQIQTIGDQFVLNKGSH